MAAELQQRFDNRVVSLVDGDVQRRLSSAIARIQIGAGRGQQLDHRTLVAERGMMHRPVAVLVLGLAQKESVVKG